MVKGKVQVTTRKGKIKKARVGMKVFPKDIIEAAKDSRAKIVMLDKNEINITPETKMEFESYEYNPNAGKKNVLLNVIHGKIRAKVKQKYEGANNSRFQVKTPSAVAGVRGTDFFTSYDPSSQSTKVVTFEGRVEFGIPGANGTIANAVMVGVGQVSDASAGSLPTQPIELPSTELKAFDQDTDADLNIQPSQPQPEQQAGLRPKQEQKRGPSNEPKLGALPPLPKQPFNTAPRLPFIPECEFCNEVIQDGTRSLILNVQHQ